MSSLTSPTSITAADSLQSSTGTSIPPPLAAVTLNRLREFRQRRDGLSIVRGLGIVTVGGVLLLLGAVWLDAWGGGLEAWTVGDMPRWLGSAMFYGITTLLLVVLCIQPKRRSLNLENEARRIEQLDARLSERLLPAVELSKSNGSHDSAAFRGQLQRQVAELMAATDVRQLLPRKAVHRWLMWAAISWLLLAGLCLLPGLHLPQRIARILLPTANLGRVSHVRIVIEQPLPLSQVVPRDDLISIVARIDGELKDEVYLETRTDQTMRQPMLRRGTAVDSTATDSSATDASAIDASATGRDVRESVSREPIENNSAANLRYEGVLQAAGAWIDYRVTADGATTGWQRLTTQPRPQVVRFHKTLHHPAYALQPPEVSSEVHGDVETFVGGRVELELDLNLPVAKAQLRWLSSVSDEVGQAAPLVLNPATGRFATQFSVKRSGAYRIELVSQETGFTNAFSATYQVIAREDLAPRLSWVQPSSQQVVAGREHLLALEVRVEDEYPLAGLTQRLRKNDGSWVDTDLTAPVLEADDSPATGASQAVRWELDLLKLDCTAGDFFDVQVVGEDRQGLHGESSLLRILVAGTSIDHPESPASRLRQELAGNLQKSATKLSQQHAPLAPLKQALESQVDSMPTHLQVTQVDATTKELALTLRSSSAALIEQVEQALAETQHGVHELELRSIGSLLSKLNAEQSRELERQAELLSAKDPSRTTAEETRQLLASVEETVRNLEELSSDVRTMVSHDVVARRAEQLSQLATAQREIVESAGVGTQSPEQRSRRQMVLGLQLRQLQTALRGSTSEVRPETAERFKQLADEMNWMLDQSDHLEEVTSPSEFEAKAADLAKSLEAYPLLHRLDGNLPNAHKDALRRTTQRAGHAGQIVDRLLQAYADPAQSETAPATALEQLTARRMLDRTGSQGDRRYASDLGDAKRSITRLLENTSQPQAERIEKIAKLAEAVETLAAANAVRSTSGLLSTLARGEKWSTESVEARIMHPQAWETYGLQVERAVGQMRETALPREIADQLEQLQWNAAAGQAGQKLTARYWQQEAVVTAAPELEALIGEFSKVESQLLEHVTAARATLAAAAPSLSELAREAAQATEEVVQQTEQLADDVLQDEVPDPNARLESLEQELTKLESPLAQLREALVDQADAQELLATKELQRARQADAALELVDRVQTQTMQSLDQVTRDSQASTTAMPGEQLQAAAAQQMDAANALEQLAQHFEDLDSLPADDATHAQAMAQLNALAPRANPTESNVGNQRDYEQAERLSRMAQASPQEILRQLERQLQVNPPMQQELSQIARSAAEQALEALEHAAAQQKAIPTALERSDPSIQAKKDLLAHDLKQVGELAQQLFESLLHEAIQTSEAGKQQVPARQLQQVQEALQAAFEQARTLNEQATLVEMRRVANTLQDVLNAAAPVLEQKGRDLSNAEAIHPNDADLNNRRREMRDLQRRLQQQNARQAQQNERRVQQQLHQVDTGLKRNEQQMQQLARELARSQKRLDENVDEQWLREEVRSQHMRLAQLEATEQAQQQLREELSQRVDIANQRRDKVNLEQPSALESKNPSSELASTLSARAAARSRDLASDLQLWSDDQPVSVRATSQQLGEAEEREQEIGSGATEAAKTLARAARHEQRLKNKSLSGTLNALARQADEVDANEIQFAKAKLATAQEDALSNQSPSGQASAEATQESLQASEQAASALAASADAVRRTLASAAQPNASASSQAASQSSSQADSSQANSQADSSQVNSSQANQGTQAVGGKNPLSPQQMARLLDELDAQQQASSELGGQDNQAANSAAAGSPSDSAASTLTEAAKQLANRLSRTRQPPAAKASADQGMATQSMLSNMNPQPPVQVRMLDIDRIEGDWGKLRERAAEEVTETRRDSLAPHVRRQVEAYFRGLSERSQQEINQP